MKRLANLTSHFGNIIHLLSLSTIQIYVEEEWLARFKLHRIKKRVKEYVVYVKYVLGCVTRSLFEHEDFMLSSVLSCYQVHSLSTLSKKIQQHLLSNN
jgi:hypothetical protein